MKNVLILGGGFAGVRAGIELQKSGRFKVTLISDRDFLYIYPISIWIPVRQTEFENVCVPLADIQRKYPFEVIIDTVKEIHASDHSVVCGNRILNYDYLIVAFGADRMRHKGIEFTYSICGRPEVSLSIRKRIDRLIEQGNGKIAIGFGGNPKDMSAVRGGPAFELIFNIHNLLEKKRMRHKFDLTFFAPMEEPGAKMGKNSLTMISSLFKKYHIDTRYGKKIREFENNSVIFDDESKLAADLILFIPASSGHHILQSSDLPLSEAGFIRIDNYCNVAGFKDVYAIGDIAALEGPDWIAKQGHIAELMGTNAAFNIIESEKGSDRRKGYKEDLNILCVMDTGNGAAFVFRNKNKSFIIPMPVLGHWIKKGWGAYSRLTKIGKFPRLPGL